MDSQTLREALGKLQVDPDSQEDWDTLYQQIAEEEGDLSRDEALRLFDAAKNEHAQRGEYDAVRQLLEICAKMVEGEAEEADFLRQHAGVLIDELLDDDGAVADYVRLLEIDERDPQAATALEETERKRERHKELVESYLNESESAPDDVYKSSMLMRASEMELRFAGDELDLERVVERLEQAVRLDPSNVAASNMLERVHRRSKSWDDVARVLERVADRSQEVESRVSAGVRLARLYRNKIKDEDRASRAYDRVLRAQPNHSEAMGFLSEFYSKSERWDELVKMYENEIETRGLDSKENLGDMFQIAMLHWRKRERPEDAEAWFERIRKLDPAHEGVLNFFREYCEALGDEARLMDILQHAQKALKDKKQKAALGKEIAKLAEGQKNAQKAIEQYKSVLRQDPDNQEARDALKRLYKQTQGYNALVELLRQQLERTPQEKYEERVEILREVATVYRQYVKSDTALVSVLNQIVQLDDKLDEHDIHEVRELVSLYEKLGRYRDLLTNQQRLAEWTDDVEEKKDLYRAVARRWLEQFSNVQNATEAYAELLKVAPDDTEARERLEELYRKRRAWPALYELYESELKAAEGAARLTLMKEMAQLAAERLNRGADAIELYKQILEADPTRKDVLDALEKHAERAKDWGTLTEALERRVTLLEGDDAARLSVLQKLGSVYADHLSDTQKAAGAWRRVLDIQPGHHRALRVLRDSLLGAKDFEGLEELYGSQNDWDGLADVLSNAADRAKETADKIDLSYRAAQVYEDKLNQPDRAFRSYERVLAVDPDDAKAARALIPLYEEDDKWSRLPALYEVLLAKAQDDDEKVALLKKLVEVTGAKLSDKKAAAEYAREAYALAPASEDALTLLEHTCRAAGSWDGFVESVEARLASPSAESTPPQKQRRRRRRKSGSQPAVSSAPPPAPTTGVRSEERRTLSLKLAEVYAEELGRSDAAIATLKKLLESSPADDEAARALDAILRREDRRDDLRWLLGLRVDNAPDDERRLDILGEWAALEEDVFEAPSRAIELHRRILELDPGQLNSLKLLPRLLLDANDAEGASKVIEQHRDVATGPERAALEIDLAQLYLDRLGRPGDSLEACLRALDGEGEQMRVIEVLEALVQHEETKSKAAELLADLYASGGDARREARALDVMLKQTEDDAERLELYQRLATVLEEKLGSHGTALDVMLEAVVRFPSELDLWDRAEALSGVTGRPTDLAERFREVLRGKLDKDVEIELSRRAAQLHQDKLGDPIGAAPYLEKMLDLDPGSETAFQSLKDILTGAERWGELEALYDRAARATDDAARKIEMLVEVALICEDIIEDAAKATNYYERIVEIEPMHDGAIEALDRLYVRQGASEKLAGLLTRRLETAVGDELFEIKLRLARIHIDLHQPDLGIDHVEDVLRERINDYEGRELAERMLEIGSLRVRAARTLEYVYEARDEIRDLVRVLNIRLEGLDEADAEDSDSERADLLRRIAVLRDDRLHDDDGALSVLCRLVPLDPLDSDARDRLLEVGRRVGAHERVAEVLNKAAERADTPSLTGEILMTVAEIYRDQLSDPERAEATYRRVLELDKNDADLVLPAARALEQIYLGAQQNEKLAEILRVQVALEPSTETRAELWGRLGELCQSVLGDTKGAIEAWKARVLETPDDDTALAALDALYQATEQYRELVSILERRRDIADDGDRRKDLLTRAAETLWKKLEAYPEAIESYQTLVDEFGADVAAMSALEQLYGVTERWEELSDTYDRHYDIVDDDGERLRLLVAQGDLKRKHLNDWDGAIGAYRRALEIDTSHAPSRAALEELLTSRESSVRREAAEILRPIYEAEMDASRLLNVLEIEIETADDPDAKLERLERAMTVAEDSLDDRNRAYSFAERAVREAAGHAPLTQYLEHLERLAAAADRRADQVKLLCDVAPDIFDGDVQLEVSLKIADLARHQLADRELAREYYQKALELRVDDPTALMALESLYEEAGDAQNLLSILERRADVAESDSDRKQLLFRRGRLLAEVVQDNKRAIEVYESILDMSLDRGAIDALEKLYPAQESWTELVALYQRQLDEGAANAADLHVNIARVSAKQLGDADRAFDELESALGLERQHSPAIELLEDLLSSTEAAEQRARAAQLLEPVYTVRADYGRLLETIRARLEFSEDPVERRELLQRLAQLYEEQQEDYVAALDTTAQLLDDDLADEDTINELERLAKVAGAPDRLAGIYAARLGDDPVEDDAQAQLARRTGELFRQLGEPEKALEYYRRALEFEPDERSLFNAIDAILEEGKRHAERVRLYRDALEHRFDARERLEVLHVVARLQRDELDDAPAAIETLQSALEVDEADEVTLDALTDLYTREGRWRDLAEHQLRRAEAAETPEITANYRLALARLYKAELGEPDRALDQLEEILSLIPSHSEALRELEAFRDDDRFRERAVEILRPLYESLDDWKRQIKLNEDRFELAADVGEQVAVLRETAELWEQRGQHPVRARLALKEAFKLDPEDVDVKANYERLTEETEAWDELALLYEDVLEGQPDIVSKRDILATLAEVQNKRRDDPRSALGAYARLHEVDPGDVTPLNFMERLSTLLSDWSTLVEVLTAKAELVFDEEERASIWRRVGEAKRDMLEDAQGAIDAYELALEAEPGNAFTVDCLIDLYESKDNAERLVELYSQRVDLCDEDDDELKYSLLVAAAETYESKLEDRTSAIEAYTRALDVQPGDGKVLQALNRLYRAEQMWPELLDNLRLEAGAVDAPERRAELQLQIGQTLAEKLENFDDALEAYRLVLQDVPTDETATQAVKEIGQDHEELRGLVAEILVPVLEQTQRHEVLVDVLEMRLTVELDPDARVTTLATIAGVLENQLSRPGDALSALLRAFGERPEGDELHEDIARLAAASNGWQRYQDVLEERAQSIFDPDVARDIHVRAGRIAEEHLKDPERAVLAYEHAVEQAGDQPELLAALDRLYTVLENYDKLSEVLDRRVVAEESESAQADLYFRLGMLQAKQFKDRGQALGSFRLALEREPSHEGASQELETLTDEPDLFEEACEVLESVYRSRGQTEKLAALYEKRIGFADNPEDRAEIRRSLSRVLEEDCNDAKAALDVLLQGLADNVSDMGLLEEVERLAELTDGWGSASDGLEKAIEASSEAEPETIVQMCIRLAEWRRDKVGDSRAAERALNKALQVDPENDDVLSLLEPLQIGEGRERDLIATLRSRAKLQFDEAKREELYRRAKELADREQDADLAESVLRELLEQDDVNIWALSELTDLREAREDYEETFALLVKRAELRASGQLVKELRHRAARIARDKLNQNDEAIELFDLLFEDDPTDTEASLALRQLYESEERFEDLARLIERLIDLAESPEARSALRLELAEMNEQRFDAVDTAVDLLQTILDEEPGHSEAVVKLSHLYEKEQRDEELAELLTRQIESASDRGDTDAELTFRVRLGEVYDSRLGDREKAIRAYRAVLERDARHQGALTALARLYEAAEDHAEAAGVLEQLLEMQSGEDAVALALSLVEQYKKLDDNAGVGRSLERGLSFDERHAGLREQLREFYESTGAWEDLAKFIARDADFEEDVDKKVILIRRAAEIHGDKRGDHTAEAELLSQASELKPDDRELLLQLCDSYSASGRGKDAAEALQRIVDSYGGRRSKELGEIHRRLANAYLAQGESGKALEELDKAFRIEPGNVGVLKKLGEVAMEVEDYKKAQQMFRALLLQRLDANSPITKAEVFMRLGQVHAKLNEKPKAIQMLERAVQSDADLEEAKNLLAELKG